MKERIAYLDHMRAVAIVMVICIHALGYGRPLPPGQADWVRFLVMPIAVPVFFFVDGFLMALRLERGAVDYAPFLRRSAFRLLLPWAVFSVLYTVLRYLSERSGLMPQHLVLGQPLSLIAARTYMSTYAPQLYFLASLFLVRAALPLVRRVFNDAPLALSAAILAAYAAAYGLTDPQAVLPFPQLAAVPGQEPVLHAVFGLQYYALGMLAARVRDHLTPERLLWPALAALAAVTAARFGFEAHFRWTGYIYLTAFYLCFAACRARLPRGSVVGRNTMGIYLLHTPVLLKGVSMVAARATDAPLAGFALTVAGCLALSLAATLVLCALPYGPVLFGMPYRPAVRAKGR